MININIKVDTTQLENFVALLSTFKTIDDDTLMKAIIKRGVEILKEEASSTEFKFGEGADIVAGMQGKVITPTKGELFNNSPKMAFIEFGTGMTGEGTASYSDDILATLGWQYDVGEHGEGWWYPVDNKPPLGQPSHFDKDKNQWYAWTRGQEAKNIFYNSIIRLRQEIPQMVTDIHLSKIKGGM